MHSFYGEPLKRGTNTVTTTADIVEGTFRVVASRPIRARGWSSPRTRRAVVRIVFWNCAAVLALVVAPLLVG